jgi:hypothetical protein
MAVFWVVTPCSLVEVYQRFRNPCCLRHQGDEKAARTSETLVNFYQTTRCCNPEDSHVLFKASFTPYGQISDKLYKIPKLRTFVNVNEASAIFSLKMVAVCLSETLVSTYKSTRRYSPEEQHQHNLFFVIN